VSSSHAKRTVVRLHLFCFAVGEYLPKVTVLLCHIIGLSYLHSPQILFRLRYYNLNFKKGKTYTELKTNTLHQIKTKLFTCMM
jgi:hypothetical protein